jgi:hypothetical protein
MVRLIFQGQTNFLPVEIVSFAAKRTDNGSVNLNFRTAKEDGVDHFEIDRESMSGWVNAGNLIAMNEKAGADYSLLDENAPSTGITYRLMEVDLDGAKKLVATTAVGAFSSPEAFGVKVYPNPTSQNIHVMLSGGSDDVTLLLYDALGKVVVSREHVSSNAIDLDAGNLSAGSYWLEAHFGETSARTKVAITK